MKSPFDPSGRWYNVGSVSTFEGDHIVTRMTPLMTQSYKRGFIGNQFLASIAGADAYVSRKWVPLTLELYDGTPILTFIGFRR